MSKTTRERTDPWPAPPVRRPPGPDSRCADVTLLETPSTWANERVPTAATQGTLALDLGSLVGAPATPDLKVAPRSGPAPEVRTWAARFAQAVVEVIGGDRPLSQLLRWTNAVVYQELDRRVRILARTSPHRSRLRSIRAQVQSVHVFQPGPESAEVSVHVRYGQRSRAIAARLELAGDRWSCTALHLG
jgi:rhodanese-related sulfurtransferase